MDEKNEQIIKEKEIISEEFPGRKGKIGEEQIKEYAALLEKYKAAKLPLEERVKSNNDWYKQRHWAQIKATTIDTKGEIEPTSAWLVNALINKHADAMDNFPQPSVLPREQADEKTANTLSSILPVILEQNNFEQVYSDNWWRKIKSAAAIYHVYWDKDKLNGLGDIGITDVDILQLFWEPEIKNLQNSAAVFHVEMFDKEELKKKYPFLEGLSDNMELSDYTPEMQNEDKQNRAAVVDCYYKVDNNVHLIKYCGTELIYASENHDRFKDTGYYIHGRYPFEFDEYFPSEGDIAGTGLIDQNKNTQMYIDKLDQAVLQNALWSARPRYLIGRESGINEEEFSDVTKQIIKCDRADERIFRPLEAKELSGNVLTVKQQKVDELKETSGNRDFSQGSTSGGVTSGAAIAALQEAGSKSSRDMIKSSYRKYTNICHMIIELIRQFYDTPRVFRIIGENKNTEYLEFDNSQIVSQKQSNEFGEIEERLPVFDIKIKAERNNPFSTAAQNQLMRELFGSGAFAPEIADQTLIMLEGMTFEGKEQLIEKIKENGTMAEMIQNMGQELQQLKMMMAQATGQLPPPEAPPTGANIPPNMAM